MDEKVLKSLAMKSMSAMLTVVLFSAVLTQYNNITIYANESLAEVEEDSSIYQNSLNSISAESLKNQEKKLGVKFKTIFIKGNVENTIGDSFIKIEKTSEEELQVLWEDLYMKRQVQICVTGLEEKTITKKNLFLEGASSDSFKDVKISYEYNPNTFLYTAILDIQLDAIYAQQVYEDKDNIYITLQNPHKVYDKIIVVDAGHGGNDIGTYTDDMKYYEKDINLSIVLYLKELMDKENNIKVYFTRLSDEKVYLNPRLNLANDLKADLFISVHCNSSDYKDARGSEVLYSTKGQKGLSLRSKQLAKVCLEELVNKIQIPNRGVVKGNNIYIIGNARVPVALIEVGFMSNPKDMKFLQKEQNRKQIAEGIYEGIIKAYEQLDNVKEGTGNGK